MNLTIFIDVFVDLKIVKLKWCAKYILTIKYIKNLGVCYSKGAFSVIYSVLDLRSLHRPKKRWWKIFLNNLYYVYYPVLYNCRMIYYCKNMRRYNVWDHQICRIMIPNLFISNIMYTYFIKLPYSIFEHKYM